MSDQNVAGKVTWREVAKLAYQAYAANTGGKNYQGNPMPEFDALPEAIKTAWEAAIRHSARVVLAASPELTEEDRRRIIDPSIWAGWKSSEGAIMSEEIARPPIAVSRTVHIPVPIAVALGYMVQTQRMSQEQADDLLNRLKNEVDQKES